MVRTLNKPGGSTFYHAEVKHYLKTFSLEYTMVCNPLCVLHHKERTFVRIIRGLGAPFHL